VIDYRQNAEALGFDNISMDNVFNLDAITTLAIDGSAGQAYRTWHHVGSHLPPAPEPHGAPASGRTAPNNASIIRVL